MTIDPKELLSVLTVLGRGQDEQSNIETTLGRSFLMVLSGKKADLPAVYAGLGGEDPVVQLILSSMTAKFNSLELSKAQITEVINSPASVRAAKAVARQTGARLGISSKACCKVTVDLASREDHYISTFANFATPETMERIANQ